MLPMLVPPRVLRIHLSLGTVLCAMALAAGCNSDTRPELGLVRGKITLDGKPLAGAGIAFRPESGARESRSITDDQGRYELNYIREIQGAAIGWHAVRIIPGGRTPISVQEKYNLRSKLRRQVVAGDNEINFELTSK
jgi:hypothetical protein